MASPAAEPEPTEPPVFPQPRLIYSLEHTLADRWTLIREQYDRFAQAWNHVQDRLLARQPPLSLPGALTRDWQGRWASGLPFYGVPRWGVPQDQYVGEVLLDLEALLIATRFVARHPEFSRAEPITVIEYDQPLPFPFMELDHFHEGLHGVTPRIRWDRSHPDGLAGVDEFLNHLRERLATDADPVPWLLTVGLHREPVRLFNRAEFDRTVVGLMVEVMPELAAQMNYPPPEIASSRLEPGEVYERVQGWRLRAIQHRLGQLRDASGGWSAIPEALQCIVAILLFLPNPTQPIDQIAQSLGISRSTLYEAVRFAPFRQLAQCHNRMAEYAGLRSSCDHMSRGHKSKDGRIEATRDRLPARFRRPARPSEDD